ncbi:RimJ/RimL family protein N-acetyltransferase [Murinocardiopsis flavida]|uniref:RimJ/RimL family protein N-acetyltransferase n=1 Tax=Murinocardiopsis flavida TaxID=645275 RepID=A0A2P8D560_9ACTN|nr:GNAT family protein [Murinocardiopsis flavida]PSK92353.1 RimJ/RimL family protein N-acetyltransferase [Murinocardiopsis flavida]
MQGHLVRLQPLTEDDYELISGWMRPGLTASLASGGPEFPSAELLRRRAETSGESILMVLTRDGRKVGFIRWQSKKYAGSYEIGGAIGDPDYWDTGCGAEATSLVLEHLFHARNAHRVQFTVGMFNVRTVKMLLNTGIVIEGLLRDYFFLDGRFHDAIVASVLRDEFYTLDEWGAIEDVVPEADKRAAAEEFQRAMRERWNGDVFEKLVGRSR